jgi:hypothetical protein
VLRSDSIIVSINVINRVMMCLHDGGVQLPPRPLPLLLGRLRACPCPCRGAPCRMK